MKMVIFRFFDKTDSSNFLLFRDHAAELGNAVPTKPLLFMKPASAYITEGTDIRVNKNFDESDIYMLNLMTEVISYVSSFGLILSTDTEGMHESTSRNRARHCHWQESDEYLRVICNGLRGWICSCA
jgi:hypothetical protein